MLISEGQNYLVRLVDESDIQHRFFVKDYGGENDVELKYDKDLPFELKLLVRNSIREMKDGVKPIYYVNAGNYKARFNKTGKIIVELVKDRTKLIVFGAGHVGRAIAQLGGLTGYTVILIDDRKEFLSIDDLGFNGVEYIHNEFEVAANSLRISRDSAVIIVTRGHQFDEQCLRGVINSDAAYIGMIGSRRRVLSIFRKLEIEGVTKDRLKRVCAPIGLRIGAVTPHEIAIAIMAEVIALQRGLELGDICHLKV